MIKQNLIIYSNPILYEILKEIENEIEYNVEEFLSDKQLINEQSSQNIVLTNKKKSKISNSIELNFPLKVSKLIEQVNIQFIRLKTKEKASLSLGKYEINLNSRLLNFNSNSWVSFIIFSIVSWFKIDSLEKKEFFAISSQMSDAEVFKKSCENKLFI